LLEGLSLDTDENYEEAIKMYNKALEINPNDPDIHLNIGESFRKWKKYRKAIASYERAIQLRCDYSDAFNSKGLNFKYLIILDKKLI
jgi:tetratricopeptide (TPR) repeat protein